MFLRTALPTVALTALAMLLLLPACGPTEDPEEANWAAHRDALEDDIEARLDAIDDVMDRVEESAEEELTPAIRAKRTELEDLRDALRDDLAELDDQTMQTWPEFARSAEARIELTSGRLEAMRQEMGMD